MFKKHLVTRMLGKFMYVLDGSKVFVMTRNVLAMNLVVIPWAGFYRTSHSMHYMCA